MIKELVKLIDTRIRAVFSSGKNNRIIAEIKKDVPERKFDRLSF